MTDDSDKLRSEAARAMGRAKTEKKADAARENYVKAREKRWADPEARARFGEAMRESWRRRKAAKAKGNDNAV